MRHEDVMEILNDPLAQEMLQSPLLARMAYNGIDGTPRAIPIGYLWSGAGFVVCTASNAPKVQALQANPKAALTIDTDTQPPHILLVRGTRKERHAASTGPSGPPSTRFTLKRKSRMPTVA